MKTAGMEGKRKRERNGRGENGHTEREVREGRRGEEGGTNGNPLPAASTEGDSEANRQDATQSHKCFHISDTHKQAATVGRHCLSRQNAENSVGRVTD